MMDRADINDGGVGKTELFAATRGPCFTGGCSKLCCNAEFGAAVADPSMTNNSRKLHRQNFGDFATITKLKPSKMGQAAREMFTDSDLFDVKFINTSITAQQKANVLAQMVHLDYMFFEQDNDMCERQGDGSTFINICNCFCYGCLCPCGFKLGGSSDN